MSSSVCLCETIVEVATSEIVQSVVLRYEVHRIAPWDVPNFVFSGVPNFPGIARELLAGRIGHNYTPFHQSNLELLVMAYL